MPMDLMILERFSNSNKIPWFYKKKGKDTQSFHFPENKNYPKRLKDCILTFLIFKPKLRLKRNSVFNQDLAADKI